MDKKKKSARNGEIELLRFVFCVIIFIFHVNIDSKSSFKLFCKGNFGVEFFFMVSGIFLTKYADTRRGCNKKKVGKESIVYVIKKYISMLSYHTIAFLCGIFICLNENIELRGKGCLDFLLRSMPQFFMIHMGGGVHTKLIVSVEWYISAMFIATLIILPIMSYNYDFCVHIVSPLFFVGISGYALSVLRRFSGMYDWTGLTTWGVLRAIMMMCAGTIVYELSKIFKNKAKNLHFHSVASMIGYFILIISVSLNFSEHARFGLIIILMYCMMVSLSELSFRSKILSNDVIFYLGKISLPMYLNTNIVRYIFKLFELNASMRYRYFVICSVIVNFVISAVELWIIDNIKNDKLIKVVHNDK